jgi:competence protein ComEC
MKLNRNFLFLFFVFLIAGCAQQITESVNEAPRLFRIPAQAARSADGAFPALILDGYAQDETPDSLLTWAVSGTQSFTISLSGSVLHVSFAVGFEGDEALEIKVTDTEGLETHQSVRFSVVDMETKEQSEDDGTMTISWTNSSPASGKVYYGESANFLDREVTAFGVTGTTLSIPLKAVSSYHTYWYRYATVSSEGEIVFESPLDSFQTFDVSSAPLFRMTTIDVRQGDSHLIETPTGKRILIDGGYGTNEPSFGDGSWDGDGVPLALNYLLGRGIVWLDHLVETHHHADHYGGLNDVRNSNISYGAYHSPSSPSGLVVGEEWDIEDTAVTVTVLNVDYPEGQNDGNENNRSIVLKFTIGQMDFIFTGDAEIPVNTNIIEHFGDFVQSEVLKVGHHGSYNATNAEWLDAVQPLFAVISCGAGNPYGHPHESTLQLLEERGIRIFRTDVNGTIDILTDGYAFLEIRS